MRGCRRCAARGGRATRTSQRCSPRHGARDDSTEVDRFLGACLAADQRTVERLLVEHPERPGRLGETDRAVIVDADGSRPAATIELMLDLGFSTDERNGLGERPLHSAAYAGKSDVIRILLERGAEVDARDARFEATPLAFAAVGSGEQAGKPGDWTGTVELLVAAGASRDGAWIVGKPPSEEVMDLVRLYGIAPEEPLPEPPDAPEDATMPTGSGVMAEVADHLAAAYRDGDLDLLASLLHPEACWTGLCRNRGEVLDWHRTLLSQGTVATVEDVEVDRDAVLLDLSVARRAEGARPVAPSRLCQVFTVDDAQAVEIRGYPDPAGARPDRAPRTGSAPARGAAAQVPTATATDGDEAPAKS